jgi:hypothetical protein
MPSIFVFLICGLLPLGGCIKRYSTVEPVSSYRQDLPESQAKHQSAQYTPD